MHNNHQTVTLAMMRTADRASAPVEAERSSHTAMNKRRPFLSLEQLAEQGEHSESKQNPLSVAGNAGKCVELRDTATHTTALCPAS